MPGSLSLSVYCSYRVCWRSLQDGCLLLVRSQALCCRLVLKVEITGQRLKGGGEGWRSMWGRAGHLAGASKQASSWHQQSRRTAFPDPEGASGRDRTGLLPPNDHKILGLAKGAQIWRSRQASPSPPADPWRRCPGRWSQPWVEQGSTAGVPRLDGLVLGLQASDVLLDAQQEAVPGRLEGLARAAGLACGRNDMMARCTVRTPRNRGSPGPGVARPPFPAAHHLPAA